MLKGLVLSILFLGISSTVYAQNVEIIKDLRPGPSTGFLQSFSSYNGELFFTGTDDGPAFQEVFSVNEDLTITKRLSVNTIRGASIVKSTDEYLYVYNREGSRIVEVCFRSLSESMPYALAQASNMAQYPSEVCNVKKINPSHYVILAADTIYTPWIGTA